MIPLYIYVLETKQKCTRILILINIIKLVRCFTASTEKVAPPFTQVETFSFDRECFNEASILFCLVGESGASCNRFNSNQIMWGEM